MPPLRLLGAVVVAAAGLVACGRGGAEEAWVVKSKVVSTTSTSTSTTSTTSTTAVPPPTTRRAPTVPTAAPATEPAPTEPTAPEPTAPPLPRIVQEQDWIPFATTAELVLYHPSRRVERVGFHESNHDGAQQLDPAPSAVAPVTLEGRERGTGSRTAADVVSDPDTEVRSPVSGRVTNAGTYVLYCDYRDSFVIIEPDAHPGWQVKVLHITGLQVSSGARVEAGQTVLASRPNRLPFKSQVDEVSAQPAWPHVHVEVVDPSVPDRPGPPCR